MFAWLGILTLFGLMGLGLWNITAAFGLGGLIFFFLICYALGDN